MTRAAVNLIIIILASFFIGCSVPFLNSAAKNARPVLSPPESYIRRVIIEVHDAAGRPLEGVRVELSPVLGQIQTQPRTLQTNNQGRVLFEVKPAVEEPMAGHRVQDRFIFYRSTVKYRLTKPGFINREGEIKDVQEFAAFQDPYYRALDREPSREFLVKSIAMDSYQSYLAPAENTKSQAKFSRDRLKKLVDALQKKSQKKNFTLPRASISFPADSSGVFKLKLRFSPYFDPAELGLLGAGAVLFRGPFLSTLSVLKGFFQPADQVETIRIDILAYFQSRTGAGTRPVRQVFTFRLPASRISSILEKGKNPPFSLKALTVEVNGQVINLSGELNRTAGER